MTDLEIDRVVRDHDGLLPASVYITICRSRQVDHVHRVGDWYGIWSRDGGYWRVTVRPD